MRYRSRMKLPAFLAVITVSAFPALVTSCAPEVKVTSAAPPTVVCGTVLSVSAAGPVLYDATRPLPALPYASVGGLFYFRVTRGCDHGSHVRWVPSSAAHLVKAARARDGLPAAVVLQPTGPRSAFRLIGTRDGRVVASAVVGFRL
jgi:hypothetical protein